MVIFIDFETRSTVDLRAAGSWKYAAHDTTSVHCMAWALDNQPVQMWSRGEEFPAALLEALERDDSEVHAWNAQFERHIWSRCQVPNLGWPEVAFRKWRCTAAKAAHANHPRGLDASAALLIPDRPGKDKTGSRMMMTMAKPGKWTKKELEAGKTGLKWIEDLVSVAILEAYCLQDVEVERAIDKVLPEWPESEVKVWQMNERINDRGVPFDRPICLVSTDIMASNLARISKKISDATDGVITTGGQIQKIKQFVNERGVNVDSLAAPILERLLETDLPQDVRDILQMRQISSGAAAKKYQSALDVMDDDDRGRGLFMYYGASATGRFASLKTQIQNMKKGVDDTGIFRDAVLTGDIDFMEMLYGGGIMTELGKNVRAMVRAPEGRTLVRCDSSQIEARVLHWLAGNQKMLDTFKAGLDPYIQLASQIFNRKIVKGDPERQLGKCAILGLGFGMGAKRFAESAAAPPYSSPVTEKFARHIVDIFRTEHSLVPKFWKNLEAAAHACVTRRQAVRVGHLSLNMMDKYMVMQLPSGRQLFYYQPQFDGSGRDMRFVFTSPRGVRYEWAGGLLCENAVQAVARDTLVHYMALAEKRGLSVVAHVHDELMVETSEQDATAVEKTLLGCFSSVTDWMQGLPCAAETTIGRSYA